MKIILISKIGLVIHCVLCALPRVPGGGFFSPQGTQGRTQGAQ